jgi:quercetin dioxygenase-like cupin family protein
MRIVITGVDPQGRSCVEASRELEMVGIPESGLGYAELFSTAGAPGPRASGSADFVDLGLEPGQIRWIAVDYAPGSATHMHHTDSVDFAVVLTGSIELELDDGIHLFESGTFVVMAGVDHLWRGGPAGCRLNLLLVGTPPPS